jgi:DNA-binding response OmpR family regulator
MIIHTILCVADDTSSAQSLASKLQLAGYAAHCAAGPSQATALLFVNRSVEAVVLDQRSKSSASFALARLLRSLRRDIPILLLSAEVVDPLPSCIDGAVCTNAGIEGLLPMLDLVLGAPESAA